jgi:hypothetical protein
VPALPAKYIDTRTVDPDELKPYPGNPNVGDVDVVQASVRANGQYRSVVARRLPDGTLELLAGHTTTLATKDELGRVRVEVIEADDATARRIVAADNQTARAASMDETALLALLDKAQADGGLDGTGFDEGEYRELVDRVWGSGDGGGEYDPNYTKAINIPQYQVQGEQPAVADLFDDTHTRALRASVHAAHEAGQIDEQLRDYLLAAAARHTVFNYRKAAEFYPHVSADVQALMEESALVIIDMDDAIRLGYAKLAATVLGLRDHDIDDPDPDDEASDDAAA